MMMMIIIVVIVVFITTIIIFIIIIIRMINVTLLYFSCYLLVLQRKKTGNSEMFWDLSCYAFNQCSLFSSWMILPCIRLWQWKVSNGFYAFCFLLDSHGHSFCLWQCVINKFCCFATVPSQTELQGARTYTHGILEWLTNGQTNGQTNTCTHSHTVRQKHTPLNIHTHAYALSASSFFSVRWLMYNYASLYLFEMCERLHVSVLLTRVWVYL